MVEVFITDVKSENLSKEILQFLKTEYPNLNTNFDLEDFNQPYPCGHSILRFEGVSIDTNAISLQLVKQNFYCSTFTLSFY